MFMITTEFKGHKLSNSNMALAFYYPEITKGGDMQEDVSKMVEVLKDENDNPILDKDGNEEKIVKISYPTLLKAYVAFRWAGDREAKNSKSVADIMDEVNVHDKDEASLFLDVMTKLLSEKSKKD